MQCYVVKNTVLQTAFWIWVNIRYIYVNLI